MRGLDGITAQALSDTIGAIYDCALDPTQWQDTFRRMVELTDSAAGGMCIHDLKNVHDDTLFSFGYPATFWPEYQKFGALSPFTAVSSVRPLGEVTTLLEHYSKQELDESRFFREMWKAFGYFDAIAITALRTTGRIASVHTSRKVDAAHYGAREIDLFKLLSPHICRALTISDALDIKALHSQMLEATLDDLVAGVYLTTRDGRVVYMNATAERQIKAGNALRIVNNRLYPTDANAREALSKAIDDVAKDQTEGCSGHSLAIPDAGGAGYVATLLPIERGRRQNILAPFAASVGIFAQDPAQAPLLPGEAFARLYGLTGGELRVLLALSQGLGAKEAADMLGIGEPTVRTHLKQLFAKTETSRQVELLRLLQSATPPVQGGAPTSAGRLLHS